MTPELAEHIFNRGLGTAAIFLIATAISAGMTYGAFDSDQQWLGRFGAGITILLAVTAALCGLSAMLAGVLVGVA
jgi:hypothetical protein